MLLIIVNLILVFIDQTYSQQCLDHQGNPVDWFALYKLPKIRDHPNKNVQKGIAYLFVTSDTVSKGWTLANDTIADETSIPGKTLSVIIGNDVEDIFWIFYNDQPPNQPYTILQGHTKGAVVGSRDKGFWLVHSVPHFPVINRQDGYVYPHTGTTYGQSLLCISLKPTDMENIGTQLMINDAKVYENTFQGTLADVFPQLKKAADMQRLSQNENIVTIQSVDDVSFLSFAKSGSFNKDLYSQWVSDELKCTLFVETWLHDDRLPSACNETYPVHNINQIKWNTHNDQFSNYKDHSKWTICAEENIPWICIGDINRASTQFTRGGGTVCLKNPNLWKMYFKMVAAVEPCPA
ncbi:deoxyribonuclease-2-alpha-like [Planococcus citri]|uniref:deoxyribonuclease-2-alpha-like n=1 Tax=Planococcus citri TaxID=170843 RepID=UPI0031F92B7E